MEQPKKPNEASLEALRRTHTPLVSSASYAPHVMDSMNNGVFRASGKGSFLSQMQDFCVNIDKFGQNVVPANRENAGLVFITRPKLNLSLSSLLSDRTFAKLSTSKVDTLGFMIRHLLDTKLCRSNSVEVNNSKLINANNPFMTPVMNALKGISGFPDETLEVSSTEGGYFNEDQTLVAGGDSLRKTYNLTLNFKDIQYSPIATIFEVWCKWMRLVTEGRVKAYSEDINRIRIPYTVSIYRFTMDPSKRFIMRSAKATGCFPTVGVNGGVFNINEGDTHIPEASNFSTPFTANHIAYNDYVTFISFNMLVEKYAGKLPNGMRVSDLPNLPDTPMYNYSGIPYIEVTEGLPRLVWKDTKVDMDGSRGAALDMFGDMVEPLDIKLAKRYLAREVKKGNITDTEKNRLEYVAGKGMTKLEKSTLNALRRRFPDTRSLLTVPDGKDLAPMKRKADMKQTKVGKEVLDEDDDDLNLDMMDAGGSAGMVV